MLLAYSLFIGGMIINNRLMVVDGEFKAISGTHLECLQDWMFLTLNFSDTFTGVIQSTFNCEWQAKDIKQIGLPLSSACGNYMTEKDIINVVWIRPEKVATSKADIRLELSCPLSRDPFNVSEKFRVDDLTVPKYMESVGHFQKSKTEDLSYNTIPKNEHSCVVICNSCDKMDVPGCIGECLKSRNIKDKDSYIVGVDVECMNRMENHFWRTCVMHSEPRGCWCSRIENGKAILKCEERDYFEEGKRFRKLSDSLIEALIKDNLIPPPPLPPCTCNNQEEPDKPLAGSLYARERRVDSYSTYMSRVQMATQVYPLQRKERDRRLFCRGSMSEDPSRYNSDYMINGNPREYCYPQDYLKRSRSRSRIPISPIDNTTSLVFANQLFI